LSAGASASTSEASCGWLIAANLHSSPDKPGRRIRRNRLCAVSGSLKAESKRMLSKPPDQTINAAAFYPHLSKEISRLLDFSASVFIARFFDFALNIIYPNI
jgi:hypothetical protein